MATSTVYIVPAAPGLHAPQARIVARAGSFPSARDNYEIEPDKWGEIGLMNFQGRVVCLLAPRVVWDELKACEPLMAGTQFTFTKE